MDVSYCIVCNSSIKIDKTQEIYKKKQCYCVDCITSSCVYKGVSYNVSTHTACHCNSIRAPIKKIINGKEITLCYSHWKHIFLKKCILCGDKHKVKLCKDGLPYCKSCELDEETYNNKVKNILDKYVHTDLSMKIMSMA